MSLLEDVFLQDEADEAQDLERVIEGEEFEERQRSDSDNDSVKGDDEAEEEKRRVDPNSTKQPKVVKNPRFVLNPARLTGPRGIQVIPDHFKDFKFKGKGHEKADLDMVLKKLEHWAYRLYPKFKFEDCLKKIETLGKKRPVMVHLQKIRSDQHQMEPTVVQQESSGDEAPRSPQPQEEDEFDKLLQQQIDMARMTPAPNSAKKIGTPAGDIGTLFAMPKATSSPSINEEQRERMLRNRRLAEERRLAKLKQATIIEETKNNDGSAKNSDDGEETRVDIGHKRNASNVIDSSDEDDDMRIDQQVTIDVHRSVNVNNTVDLTNAPKNVEMSSVVDVTENVISDGEERSVNMKHKRYVSNIVDSSDEDDDMRINQTVTIDVHTSVNENDPVDLTNVEETSVNIKLKRNVSNVIDSHYDDNDIMIDQQVKIIDIHKSVIENSTINLTDTTNVEESYNRDDLIENVIQIPRLMVDKVDDLTEMTNSILRNTDNVIDGISSDDECNINSVNQSITVDVHEPFRNRNKNECVNDSLQKEKSLTENNDSNQEKDVEVFNNKDSNMIDDKEQDLTENVMDVDFTDEF